MSYRVKTLPTLTPVTVDEVKANLKIDGTEEDAMLLSRIKSATAYAEKYTGLVFNEQTIEYYVKSLPSCRYISLSPSPVIALVSVGYTDSDGNPATIDITDLNVSNITTPNKIWLKYGKSWPTGSDFIFEYTAGNTDITKIPQEAIQAIHLMVGHMTENREDTVKKQPTAAENLLDIIRIRQIR